MLILFYSIPFHSILFHYIKKNLTATHYVDFVSRY